MFLFVFILTCIFMVIITNFYHFHLKLVLTNTTTLEHLEHEKEKDNHANKPPLDRYDVGKYYNWIQVYGSNVLLWFFPLTMESGKLLVDSRQPYR